MNLHIVILWHRQNERENWGKRLVFLFESGELFLNICETIPIFCYVCCCCCCFIFPHNWYCTGVKSWNQVAFFSPLMCVLKPQTTLPLKYIGVFWKTHCGLTFLHTYTSIMIKTIVRELAEPPKKFDLLVLHTFNWAPWQTNVLSAWCQIHL